MEQDETFDKFYAHFLNNVNNSYNLGRSINKENQIEKIIASFLTIFVLKL